MGKNKIYQITGYQAILPNGCRDNVKFVQPILSFDIEKARMEIKEEKSCQVVNLTYIEIEV